MTLGDQLRVDLSCSAAGVNDADGGLSSTGSTDRTFNAVTVYAACIILLIACMGLLLDKKVPYGFVFRGSPGACILYTIGMVAWGLMLGFLITGTISNSTEDIIVFATFTLTILWPYSQQFTLLWDTLWDQELYFAVARAFHARQAHANALPGTPAQGNAAPMPGVPAGGNVVAPQAAPTGGNVVAPPGAPAGGIIVAPPGAPAGGNVVATPGAPAGGNVVAAAGAPVGIAAVPGHVARVQVLASGGFPHFDAWQSIPREIASSRSLLRWLQCVPLIVSALYSSIFMLVFMISTQLAQAMVRCNWRAAMRQEMLDMLAQADNIATVLPRLPAWGMWAFSQALNEDRAIALLTRMTGAGNDIDARNLARQYTGQAAQNMQWTDRHLLLTLVVVLVNRGSEPWEWQEEAVSPTLGDDLARLWETRF